MITLSKYLSILTALITLNQAFILTPAIPQPIYYSIFAGFIVVFIFNVKGIKINPLMLLFLLIAGFSILANDIPGYIQAPFRLLSFILIVSLIGPFFQSPSLNFFKAKTFQISNQLLLLLGALTFFVYILPLEIPQGRGGFTGFMVHSMTLGPFLGVAIIFALNKLYDFHIFKFSKIKKHLLIVAIVLIFISLLLASSRSAILATLGGSSFFFFKYYQYRLGRLFLLYTLIPLGVIFSFPLWEGYTDGIQKKIEYSERNEDIYATRRSNWDMRLAEFQSSPIIGIGFANMTGHVNVETGTSEPGSSWFAVLAQTGVLGAGVVILLFLGNLWMLIRDKENRLMAATLGGLLVLFILHMMAEGYLLASGSYLFFYLWLLLGNIQLFKTYKNFRII
ncbi:O-antigen ligase family protein [Fontibacter flavus]|uniref:O-antigen ligase family protein n=1 Tax=Fontibacter flavus TaxID=654838 RepID=A0ABV6FVZ4_9BACT